MLFLAETTFIAGVDEAGRGPLAGPVVCAAVILPKGHRLKGLTDSKKLSEASRERLYAEIMDIALAVSIASSCPAEIDELNIRGATLAAMTRAVKALHIRPSQALIDGRDVPPGLPCYGEAIIGGDLTQPEISAASIIAKVTRDRQMRQMCESFPGYGFSSHKGYGTAAHLAALEALGPCEIHRKSFAPVAKTRNACAR